MDELSKEKLNTIKNSKNFTNAKISELTGIKLSTVEKIFSGTNKNPTLDTLKKIAKALDCSIDDFINYEEEPTSPYYLDRKTGELAQEIHDNPDLRILLDASRDLSPEDLKTVITVAQKIKGNTNG